MTPAMWNPVRLPEDMTEAPGPDTVTFTVLITASINLQSFLTGSIGGMRGLARLGMSRVLRPAPAVTRCKFLTAVKAKPLQED